MICIDLLSGKTDYSIRRKNKGGSSFAVALNRSMRKAWQARPRRYKMYPLFPYCQVVS